MERGKFITIEGIEGVGKSTNMAALVAEIEKAGHKVLTTREPGGTPLAEDIRDIIMNRGDEPVPEIAEVLLMFAARSFNVNNVIVPALEAGTWVVCDRFTDSTRAYQGGGRGIPMDTIDRVADWVHGDTWPDVTILLDAYGFLPAGLNMGNTTTTRSSSRICSTAIRAGSAIASPPTGSTSIRRSAESA